jgi:predicted nucleic acid-binding protein
MKAVDTNVLVYVFDNSERAKQARAVALVNGLVRSPGSAVLLWQTAVEFLSCLRRWESTGRISTHDVENYIAEVLSYFPLAIPSADVLSRSMQLTSRYSLSHWDSLLVSAALEVAVDTLYTEDLQSGARYDTLAIVNPFI